MQITPIIILLYINKPCFLLCKKGMPTSCCEIETNDLFDRLYGHTQAGRYTTFNSLIIQHITVVLT